MKTPRPSRRKASRARWFTLIKTWRTSSLSATDFARQEGVSTSSLYRWSRRLDLAEPPLPVSSAQRLLPITLATPALCELLLRSGRVLRFDPALDMETLQRLLRAAEVL